MSMLEDWKILIIDDEPDSLKVAHDLLRREGAKVFTAATAAEFRHLWRVMIPTAVLLDLSMPKPNGWELLGEIHHTLVQRKTVAIAVTAFYSHAVLQEADRVGFAGVIPKPLRSSTFADLVREIVERAGQAGE